MRSERAPRWFVDYVTFQLIKRRVPYIEGVYDDDPAGGFDCWGCTRHLTRVSGYPVPRSWLAATNLIVKVNDQPLQYRDWVIWWAVVGPGIHIGFMENEWQVVHSSEATNGVARMDVEMLGVPAFVGRLKCLLS